MDFPADDPANQSPSANHLGVDIANFAGQIVLGPYQFYTSPTIKHFQQRGAANVELVLLGCSWYDTKPDFDLEPSAKASLLGNFTVGMSHAQFTAADQTSDRTPGLVAAALDDLRRLGQADLHFNHGL